MVFSNPTIFAPHCRGHRGLVDVLTAGEAGWKSIIPIYNIIVLLKIVGREWWWVILLIIPIVGFIVWIIVALDLAKSYGRGSSGFGLIGFAFHSVSSSGPSSGSAATPTRGLPSRRLRSATRRSRSRSGAPDGSPAQHGRASVSSARLGDCSEVVQGTETASKPGQLGERVEESAPAWLLGLELVDDPRRPR